MIHYIIWDHSSIETSGDPPWLKKTLFFEPPTAPRNVFLRTLVSIVATLAFMFLIQTNRVSEKGIYPQYWINVGKTMP